MSKYIQRTGRFYGEGGMSQSDWDAIEAKALARPRHNTPPKVSRGYNINLQDFLTLRLLDYATTDQIIIDLYLLNFPLYKIHQAVRRGFIYTKQIINNYNLQCRQQRNQLSSSESVDINNQAKILSVNFSSNSLTQHAIPIGSPLQTS